ncbi:hypothetical protein [Thermomonospora amylolytica]|uniref:hypothetical protein n=1 Tax=Thermomonospora amylolytica TaxID=1411117 RepID=UPI000E6C4354|nr:hypothetical protein [Thermomonospora amylolytica]
MQDRELKLNSLSRYAKSSPLFILEEHGHCEVPAGCGGVVLRWRDPRAGVPFTLWSHTPGQARLWLDGAEPPSSRPVVGFGEHALALAVEGVDPAFMVLMFAAGDRPDQDRHVKRSAPELVRHTLTTADDGTWRYTFDEPRDDSWKLPGFDDSGWPPMVRNEERPPPEDPEKWDPAAYRITKLTGFGAVGLGVEGRGDRVWIRKEFTIPAPGGQEA